MLCHSMTLTTSKRESLATRSLIIRGCRFLFSRRCLRLVLIIFAWLITMIALFYGVENWRGRRAWNKIRQKLQADGVAIDFKSYIPKPVPPEQNFAGIPLVKSWFEPDGQAKK